MDETYAGFSNRQIRPGSLPDFRRVDLDPVATSFMPYAVLVQVAFWLVLVLAVVLLRFLPFSPLVPAWWIAGVPLLAGTWFGTLAWLDARRRGWALREHDLIYRYGIIWRKVVIVPFARIQHVETSSGPLERLFGLMRVKCFTAGGMTADLSVVGLDTGNAKKVRQYLLEQIRSDTRQSADEQLTDEPKPDTAEDEQA